MYQKNNNINDKVFLFKANGTKIEQGIKWLDSEIADSNSTNHIHQTHWAINKLIHDKSILIFERL